MNERTAFLDWVGQLVPRHRQALLAVARAEGLTPEDAFDSVQEAFATFTTLPAAAATRDRPPEEAGRLLATITRNVARNHRRLHHRARPHEGDAALGALAADLPSADELLDRTRQRLAVVECVRTLAAIQRAVVTLRMLEELPGEEVARSLGLTPGHVAVLLHRAKAQLLACLERPLQAAAAAGPTDPWTANRDNAIQTPPSP